MAHKVYSDVEWVCPRCQSPNHRRVEVPEVDWQEDSAADRMTNSTFDLMCHFCAHTIDVMIVNNDSMVSIQPFDESDPVTLSASNAFTDWDYEDHDSDYDDIPNNPGEVFGIAILSADQILDGETNNLCTTTPNKLALVHYFSAFEAYLSDTLINAILDDTEALKELWRKDRELKAVNFKADDIFEGPPRLRQPTINYLQGLIYHNFDRINAIYEASLGFKIWPDEDVASRLMKSVPIRHDCVHRNGKDKNGVTHTFITKRYVKEIAADMTLVKNHVDYSLIIRAFSDDIP